MRNLPAIRHPLAVAGWLLALAIPGAAQQGSITGHVTDQTTSRPIPGARLQLIQTGQVVTVRNDGRYSYGGLGGGTYEIRVIAVGYGAEKKSVAVAAGQAATLDFALSAVPFTLEEIVTTATGQQRRLELGHTIGTIKADSITAYEPVTSMTTLLQARTAGVTILPSAGTTGAGTRIRIRGANSVSLSNEPLIFIDGVKVNSSPNSSSLGTGGQSPSRLNDINPNEIENIEIVKGSSAATLYGTEAANGVIRITTKRGQPGRAKWNFFVEGGKITDPNSYLSNYRALGRFVADTLHRLQTCNLVSQAAGTCIFSTLLTTNILEETAKTPISTGYRQQYGGSVSGGSDVVQYYVSGDFEGEAGTFKLPDAENTRLLTARGLTKLDASVLRPNYNKKVSLRANLSSHPTEKVDIQVSTGYVSGNLRLPQNDNNVLGMLPSGYFGTTDTLGVSNWGFFAPGEIFSLYRNQNIERFTGSANANWRPLNWLTARGTAGYDIGNRTDITFDPTGQGPAFSTFPLGNKSDARTQLKTYTVDLGVTSNFKLTDYLSSRTTVGSQYYKDIFFQNVATGSRLSPGSKDIDGAAILTASQTTTPSVKLGVFAEQQFTIRDRLFLTGAVRVDKSSAFGQNFGSILYPKASISYLISDEPFFPKTSFISLFRIRASYGQTGRQPGALDALTYLAPTASAVTGASTSAVQFGGLGLAGLKPERSREREVGFDLGLMRDRFNLEATYFLQRTTDELVARVLAPSVGGPTTRFENLGTAQNKGVELTLNARIIDSRNVSWDAVFSGSTLKSALLDLGLDAQGKPIPPVISGIQRHTPCAPNGGPCYPLGGFWERPITGFTDTNGNGIIELSEITVGDTAVYAGSPTPTKEAALNTTLSLLQGQLRLQGQLDYKGGFKQYNLTEVFRCTATGNNCRGIMDKTASFEDQARAVVRRFHPSASNWGYLEDGEFLKLREVSVTYVVPIRWARMFGAERFTLTAAGRNLATWTGYTGVDPEVNGAGQTAFNGFGVQDFLTQPPVRTFLVRVSMGF
jgi:TonB-linked SusC/RagA family outer membrane protein